MKYKTVVLKYNPRAKKMAEELEKKRQTNMPKKVGRSKHFPLLFPLFYISFIFTPYNYSLISGLNAKSNVA